MKKYFAVLYRKDGHISVSKPLDTESECVELMKEAIRKNPEKFFATTYMVREYEEGEFLFGHPKSRDLFQNKRFMEEL